jgi:hypothetical protein
MDPRSQIRYDVQYRIGMSTRMYRFSVHCKFLFFDSEDDILQLVFYSLANIIDEILHKKFHPNTI